MSDKVSFSSATQSLEEISDYYKVTAEALRKYYNTAENSNPIPARFIGLSQNELEKELTERLNELNKNVSLSLLSAIEASLRIDYLNRVYRREKDDLSRVFREIHKTKGNKASLEEDILSSWKKYHPKYKSIFSDIMGALKYRHWLAHGRYWVPKLGRQYDFYSISIIAIRFYQDVPLIN
jgi:hypothetical protein